MIVSDVFDDAKEFLGFANETKIYGRITDAIEVLANKGQWEPLLAYLIIPTIGPTQTRVFLPDRVEVPLRVTLDGNPTLARDRLYEFTMNGPGTYDERVDWSWEDQGVATFIPSKPTQGNPIITADAGGNIVSQVGTASRRMIRLSKGGVAVRMLVRLKTTKITTKQDFIPLHSKMSLLLMLKALESYRRGSPQDFALGQQQEQQALKFLAEEQQSRNVFTDLAKTLDNPPLMGFPYHSADLVTVQDIYDEACKITGGVGRVHVFNAIQEAVEALANKAQWDSLTMFVDLRVGTDATGGTAPTDLVGLPSRVEAPIKINIEDQPVMPRNRLFEFSTDGPGSSLEEVNILTWEDKGSSPVQIPLTTPQTVEVGGNPSDYQKVVTIRGISSDGYSEIKHDYVIPQQPDVHASWNQLFSRITSIDKPVTLYPVYIYSNHVPISVMFPDETIPEYRLIKLSKKASSIKVMYRAKITNISSVSDILPLKSRGAILNMMRAQQLLKAPEPTPDKIAASAALELQAVKLMQEEEQSKLAYVQASSRDQLPAFGIHTNSQGVLLAGEVYDEACDIFGPISKTKIFDKITEAMELLSNKSQWSGQDGYVDLVADQRGYMTFPRKVEVPIGVNFFRSKTEIRNKWYEFHMNGLSTDPVQGNFLDDLGEYPLIHEPSQPVQLFATAYSTKDAGSTLRVYGYTTSGDWARSQENGEMVDGVLVPVSQIDVTNPTQQIPATDTFLRMITRVTKSKTDLPISLYGVPHVAPPGWTYSSTSPSEGALPPTAIPPAITSPPAPPPPFKPELLGYYEPEDEEPMFRRVRVPTWVTWARMRYRTRNIKITKMSDPLNMKSKTALITMLRSMKALETDPAAAQAFELTAVKMISEEEMSRNPSETFDLQFDQSICFADPLQGRY